MSDLYLQRRLAAAVAGCGIHRVWLDPEKRKEIEGAISRDDVRALIENGTIRILPKRGNSRGRARARIAKRSYGHRKGHGKRKGAKYARFPRKRRWIQKIRALRRVLRELRAKKEIDPHTYRRLYRKASGGEIRDVSHLRSQIELLKGRGE